MSWKGDGRKKGLTIVATHPSWHACVLVTRALVKQLIMDVIVVKRFPLNDQKDDR